MEAIIISGMPAAGKTEASKRVAKRLGLKEFGGSDILKEMAGERGYILGGSDWWDTEEGLRFLKEREKDPEFDRETDRRMTEKIKRGDIVVTSYTMPWLSDVGFKVWLDASHDVCAARMAKRDGTDVERARKVVAERDRRNCELYEKLYNIKLGRDKKPFDVIINTDNLTPEQIAERIIEKMKEKGL
jgi:cytidylate kinase